MRHLALAVFVLTASVTAQIEHAPTVAQCQADQRLWLSQLEEKSPNLPTFYILHDRTKEMDDCEKVDPDKFWKYYNTSSELSEEQSTRMFHFLDRHNMWDKFIDEDATGKR